MISSSSEAEDEDDEPAPRRRWAWLLRHVFQVDLDTCPSCGGAMRWVEAASTAEAARDLLARLGLRPRPPPLASRPPLVEYFRHVCRQRLDAATTRRLEQSVLKASRFQYILSGAQHPRFLTVLAGLVSAAQGERVARALAPIAA